MVARKGLHALREAEIALTKVAEPQAAAAGAADTIADGQSQVRTVKDDMQLNAAILMGFAKEIVTQSAAAITAMKASAKGAPLQAAQKLAALDQSEHVITSTPDVQPSSIQGEQFLPNNINPTGQLFPARYGEPPFQHPKANILVQQQLHDHNVKLPRVNGPDGTMMRTPGEKTTLDMLDVIPEPFRDFSYWLVLMEYFNRIKMDPNELLQTSTICIELSVSPCVYSVFYSVK